MKKFIALFSFLTLMFATTAFAKVSQAEYGTEVEIPFAFSVGEREYSAGKYIVKLQKLQNGSATLAITDSKNERVQVMIATRNNEASSERVDLVFEKVGDKRLLSRIATPSGTFAVAKPSQKNVPARTTAAAIGGINDLF